MMREDLKRVGSRVCALALVAIAISLGMASCGGGSSTTTAIDLKSPGVQANGELKASVRCGWGSLWVPLEWGDVPADTKEIAILLARFKDVKDGNGQKPEVRFADLVSKFKPTEHRLVANVLPQGVSWSYFGTNCISSGRGQRILLEVFALDNVRDRKVNRALATRLAEEALASPDATEAPRAPGELTEDATAVGHLITTNFTGPH